MQRRTSFRFFLEGDGAPRSRISHVIVMDGIAMYLYNNTTHFKDFLSRKLTHLDIVSRVRIRVRESACASQAG